MDRQCSELKIKQETPDETDYNYGIGEIPSEEPTNAHFGCDPLSNNAPIKDFKQIKKEDDLILDSSEKNDLNMKNALTNERLKSEPIEPNVELGYQSNYIKQEPELMLESDELPPDQESSSETSATKPPQKKRTATIYRQLIDPNKCYLCDLIFDNPESREMHLAVHMDMLPYECEVCTSESGAPVKITSSLVQLHRHVQMHTNKLKCPKCPSRFNKKRSLSEHVLTKHSKDAGDKEACPICGVKMIRRYLMRHMRGHESLEEGRYTCSFCGRKCKSRPCLISHERCHTNEHPYKCKYCSKTFKTQSPLIGHERIHTGEKPYSCQICGSSYRWLSSLKVHSEAAHGTTLETPSQPPEYKCEMEGCDFRTNKRTQLTKHRAKHRMEYQCTFCSKRFPDGNQLKMHEGIHQERNFHCEQCSKSFRTKRYLTKHMVLHGTNRQFVCRTCDKSYFTKQYLRKHLMKHVECQSKDQMDVIIGKKTAVNTTIDIKGET